MSRFQFFFSMTKLHITVATVCLLLSGGGAFLSRAAAEEKSSEPTRRKYGGHGVLGKLTSVVEAETPPTIDGIRDEGEWDAAAAITGLTIGAGLPSGNYHLGGMKNVASDQSTFWITYDHEKLYIAYHCPPPARLGDDPALVAAMLSNRDNVRLSVVVPYPFGDDYWIWVNRDGASAFTHGSATHSHTYRDPASKLQGVNLEWNPRVEHGSTLTAEGWRFEVAVPWEDFGPHVKRPAPGESLHMNFGRHWHEVMSEDHIWKLFDTGVDCCENPREGAADDPHRQKGIVQPAGEVLFQGKEGVVVQLEDVGNLPRGQAAFVARVLNGFGAERSVLAEVHTDSGELRDTRVIALSPGESEIYRFEGRIVDFATTKIAFRVKDLATGRDLHVTTLPVIRKTKPDIRIRRYRSFEVLKLETDLAFLGAVDLDQTEVELSLIHRGTGDTVHQKTVKGLTSYEPVFELSTSDWPLGSYDARFGFSAPGMKTREVTISYEHVPLPEWWNNRHGYTDMDSDRVPYPWTDMKVENESIHVWGRQYRFGQRLFPEQITTLYRSLLRAPMRVFVKTADGYEFDSAAEQAKSEWTKTKKTRVEGKRVGEGDGFSLENAFWSEYDGLVWSTLRIVPRKKIEIVSMELEIPLTKEFTDVSVPHRRSTGKLQPDGFTASPRRTVWLGNGDGGLQWFCETDGWFFVEEIGKALRVEVHAEGATLRVVMIDTPTEFDAPHEVEFGFIATPVRPKTWRTPEHSAYRSPITDAGGGAAWYQPEHVFVPAPDIGVPYGGGGGTDGCLYVFSSHINTRTDASGTDDFRHFGDEWLANASERTLPGETAMITGASKSLRDWFVWRYWRFQELYGFGGLYYDGLVEVTPKNPYACAGYTRRDGSVASITPILGARDIHKRLYNIVLSNPNIAARDTWIGEHQSGQPSMAYMGFSNHNWTAEHFNGIINDKQPTYLGVVDPAMFRAEFMGHNFGWPVRFLGQSRILREYAEANGGPEAVHDHLVGLVLLHDAAIPYHMPNSLFPGVLEQVSRRLHEAIDRHRFFHWAYQFTPYWRQKFVELPDENMHASFFISEPSRLGVFETHWSPGVKKIDDYFDRHLPRFIKNANRGAFVRNAGRMTMDSLPPRKVILIVYNNSEWEGEMRLRPDWKGLGYETTEGLLVENAVHRKGFRVDRETDADGKVVEKGVLFDRPEEYARIEDGQLVFPMTKWSYRMIVIEKAESGVRSR